MAFCVEIETVGANAGFIKQSAQTLDVCTDYVIISATEYQSLPTLTDIFTMPLQADLQQMWMTGFELPIIAYLAAWAYGAVINWFNDNRH